MRCANLHIDINIKGTWSCCQVAILYMLKQGDGSIVIASSVTGDIVADAGEVACAMPKAALVGLIKCLAVEYASCCIRVNRTQLGYTRTPMVEKMAREFNRMILRAPLTVSRSASRWTDWLSRPRG
jgi:NAD(P)-dependent dehydrogenase (short-subunit alcohol dehydrogenase family)